MKTHKIAILGYPIKHTLSPKMHNYWLRELNINGKYEAINTPIQNLKKTIEKLYKLEYKGLNLTIPLKEEILKYLNKKDETVNTTGAANVVIFSNQGHLIGKNTDIYGFKKSLENFIKNKERRLATIIGSGGAARAVLHVLIQMKYKKIILYNRTIRNAETIKKNFLKNLSNRFKIKIICQSLKKNKNNIKQTDLLINTTPMGMKDFPNLNIDIKNLKANSAVFDLIYNPIETKLIKEAKKRGIINTNGLDMLIYQAQRSFYYWFNRTPKITNKLKKILEKEIK